MKVYWAIENGQQRTLERLVEHGVDVNMYDGDGLSFNVEELLWNAGDFRMKACRLIGNLHPEARVSPLAWAASRGRDSLVEYLLDHDAKIEQESLGLCNCRDELLHCPRILPNPPEIHARSISTGPDDFDYYYRTPLHFAICNGEASTAQLLLERGADATNLGDIDGDMKTALHLALCCGLNETVNYLLDKELVDINTRDMAGVTVLHMAHLAGEYDLVDKLLDKGADINTAFSAETGPWTVFSMACAERLFDRALQYLRRGAYPHLTLKDEYGNKFTVMKLIYFHESDLDDEKIEQQMRLEDEIIVGRAIRMRQKAVSRED